MTEILRTNTHTHWVWESCYCSDRFSQCHTHTRTHSFNAGRMGINGVIKQLVASVVNVFIVYCVRCWCRCACSCSVRFHVCHAVDTFNFMASSLCSILPIRPHILTIRSEFQPYPALCAAWPIYNPDSGRADAIPLAETKPNGYWGKHLMHPTKTYTILVLARKKLCIFHFHN